MNGKRIGNWFIFGGLLLLAAALCLGAYNVNEQVQAARSAADALHQLDDFRMHEDREENLAPEAGASEELEIPDYLRDPNMPMPELEINGQAYIGVVSIPSAELELPVISQWSYPRLKIAPCRYLGSVYLDDLIIMAHNYLGQFAELKNVRVDDEVFFEDMRGNVFQYRVVEKEILDKTSVEEMVAGEWDLTLFTCTPGGKSRVTVRCEQVKE